MTWMDPEDIADYQRVAEVCDGCGAGEGSLSITTSDGRAYCCRTCRNGGRCDCLTHDRERLR